MYCHTIILMLSLSDDAQHFSVTHTHTRFHKRLAVTLPVWYGTALWWKLSPTSLTGQFIVTQKCDWLTDRQTDL